MKVGLVIKNIRKERTPQLNQTDFAKLIGITQPYLSQIESELKTPSMKVLETISNQFEIPIPIIFWLSITDEDISMDKRSYFSFIKPNVDSIINEFY